MRKQLKDSTSYEFIVNAYFIRAFAWTQGDPENINTAKLVVHYDLAHMDKDGKLAVSPYPEHCGLTIQVYNVGGTETLTTFLKESGKDKASDFWEFNYHDLQRLVEQDILERFDLKV